MCALHHDAYDRALIAVRPDYSVTTSADALRRLRRLDRHSGWDEFEDDLRDEIVLPARAQDRPDPDALQEGL